MIKETEVRAVLGRGMTGPMPVAQMPHPTLPRLPLQTKGSGFWPTVIFISGAGGRPFLGPLGSARLRQLQRRLLRPDVLFFLSEAGGEPATVTDSNTNLKESHAPIALIVVATAHF